MGQKASACGPLGKDPVWCLGIHIDEPCPLFHRHQVIGRLALGIVAVVQIHCGPGNQQLPAAAGIFHMADFLPAVDLHQCDEAVGPGSEGPLDNVVILHRSFLLFRQVRKVSPLPSGTYDTTIFPAGEPRKKKSGES